jgi:hypothetical protein
MNDFITTKFKMPSAWYTKIEQKALEEGVTIEEMIITLLSVSLQHSGSPSVNIPTPDVKNGKLPS